VHILLIDDHEMFRQGMKFLLSDLDENLEFTDAADCAQALAALAAGPVDLALLDLNMPGSSGLSALREIKEFDPALPVAVLSGLDDPALIRDAIDAGASGFVPKASSSEVLVAALKLILVGGVYLPRAALDGVRQVESQGQSAVSVAQAGLLSARQTDVLLKAIQGKPNKIIAREMHIAEGTVKTHLSAAFKVLGVHNRTEAVFAAARLGLTPAAPGQS
jgi:DNA-binding NarL/FixJ family response regulator